jgi:5-methylcytosine-specific restriction endonuclease McrA
MARGFDYPGSPHTRRHGPRGYANYRSYRPWLRDEFAFRCVYCLVREQWGRVTGEFDLDHYEPQRLHPHRARDYDNLLYSCSSCNL